MGAQQKPFAAAATSIETYKSNNSLSSVIAMTDRQTQAHNNGKSQIESRTNYKQNHYVNNFQIKINAHWNRNDLSKLQPHVCKRANTHTHTHTIGRSKAKQKIDENTKWIIQFKQKTIELIFVIRKLVGEKWFVCVWLCLYCLFVCTAQAHTKIAFIYCMQTLYIFTDSETISRSLFALQQFLIIRFRDSVPMRARFSSLLSICCWLPPVCFFFVVVHRTQIHSFRCHISIVIVVSLMYDQIRQCHCLCACLPLNEVQQKNQQQQQQRLSINERGANGLKIQKWKKKKTKLHISCACCWLYRTNRAMKKNSRKKRWAWREHTPRVNHHV